MSANNQAAAQEPASGAAAMMAVAASSEYLKRTCLICGCHTNQTINIYEPRSGPNIVQLIQAKFKFQPLNEDKYLCFSCNNWLINWHSLQAVNSNDAESQSPSHLSNNSSSLAQEQASAGAQNPVKQRPVARVAPSSKCCNATKTTTTTMSPAAISVSYSKRRFRRAAPAQPSMRTHKMLRACCVCGGAMVLRLTAPALTLTMLKRSRHAQCRKCREIYKWRALHMRSLAKVAQLQQALAKRSVCSSRLVKDKLKPRASEISTNSYQRYPQPSVDGKVVAMFRRLGTTLSRESQSQSESRPVVIMSPAKQRPRWTRSLESDEILLEFDSAISEVLPASERATTARRRLSYQLTDTELEQQEDKKHNKSNKTEVENSHQLSATEVPEVESKVAQALQDFCLPKGLSISLV